MNYRKLFLFLCLLPLIAGAQNITGRITCDGRGIKGVAVSDGDMVTTTDKDGHYALESKKRNGYVFYSIPRGYEAEIANGFNPQFWQTLTSPSTAVAEQHDFCLRKVRNKEFRFLIGTDVHLARRVDDVDQFRRLFIPCLAKERKAAGDAPIYSMMLGDLAWDIYWTQNDFNLQDFQNALREYKGTVMIVSHDKGEAYRLCDRIAMMRDGTAGQILTKEEWLSQSKSVIMETSAIPQNVILIPKE